MKHIDFFNYLELKTLGKELPCNCDICLEKIKKWERDRENFKNFEDFNFQKQERYLLEKIRRKVFPFKMVFAFGFTLILIFGFFALSSIKSKKIENFELEYSKIMEVYQRPDLGDLEACSIIFEVNNKEEDL
ncbi:MAG: hypothetical protein WHV67_10840 [Thermoanaerobaculia bacterium]